MSVLHTILTIAAVLLSIPAAVLLVQCTAAIRRPRTAEFDSHADVQYAVLVPAHNEEQGVGATVHHLLQALTPGGRLIVIADNCSDRTAEEAASAGAQVLVRSDPQRRGKGYALAHAVESLQAEPPAVIVIVDADTRVSPGGIEALVRGATAMNRPMQAVYRLSPPANPTARDRISALAFAVKNVVRPRGMAALALPCQLAGTGMALPYDLARQLDFGGGHLTEDIQLGVRAAMLGCPPRACFEATVHGELPAGAEAAATQRTRWEHGHLQTIFVLAPRLLLGGILRARPSVMAMALDLAVPPLALLVMLLSILLIAAAALGAAGGGWLATAIAGGGLLAVAVAVLVGWFIAARQILPLRHLLAVPLYIVWKIPIYLRFLVRRQHEWVRTDRAPGTPEDVAPPAAGPQPLSARK